jgi:predicted nucleic acid-binding protein
MNIHLHLNFRRSFTSGGSPKAFSDLVIASISINRIEELITKDSDFENIAEVSSLNLVSLNSGI